MIVVWCPVVLSTRSKQCDQTPIYEAENGNSVQYLVDCYPTFILPDRVKKSIRCSYTCAKGWNSQLFSSFNQFNSGSFHPRISTMHSALLSFAALLVSLPLTLAVPVSDVTSAPTPRGISSETQSSVSNTRSVALDHANVLAKRGDHCFPNNPFNVGEIGSLAENLRRSPDTEYVPAGGQVSFQSGTAKVCVLNEYFFDNTHVVHSEIAWAIDFILKKCNCPTDQW